MGTNYYLHNPKPCQTCGHDPNEPKHIGKSSAGWVFSLHVYPEEGIHDLGDWEREWVNGVIKDEYGSVVTVDEMRLVIMARARPERWDEPPFMSSSWEEFHRDNYSERGPAGLIRTDIARSGSRCVKHGDGTWDCFVGEFC
jgi:hypothetical protein